MKPVDLELHAPSLPEHFQTAYLVSRTFVQLLCDFQEDFRCLGAHCVSQPSHHYFLRLLYNSSCNIRTRGAPFNYSIDY